MTGLTALWLPILLSAVFVFVLSSIIHMATPWHKNDYLPMPNEDKVRDALRPLAIPPGDYMVPRAGSMAEMGSPAFQEKLQQGPVFIATVMPNGVPSMGSQLAKWFLYSLVMSVFAAYVTGRALGQSSPYLSVFRFAGVAAFLGYGAALWPFNIWYHRSLNTTIRATIDALLYALVTAGTFGWLWPQW